MRTLRLALLTWWFLVQAPGGHATPRQIGPFAEKVECEYARSLAESAFRGNVRTTSCWFDGFPPAAERSEVQPLWRKSQ